MNFGLVFLGVDVVLVWMFGCNGVDVLGFFVGGIYVGDDFGWFEVFFMGWEGEYC